MAYLILISLYVHSLFPQNGCLPTYILKEDEAGSASFLLKIST